MEFIVEILLDVCGEICELMIDIFWKSSKEKKPIPKWAGFVVVLLYFTFFGLLIYLGIKIDQPILSGIAGVLFAVSFGVLLYKAIARKNNK